jgi:heptosyltransferase II
VIAAAVVQPLPGIGDMIWHLPHIHAIAAHVGQPVTLITKPRSAADQIFAADPSVGDIFWLDRNPERRRGRHDGGTGFFRVVLALRARRFDEIYVLHHSKSIAFLLMLAGIPVRRGYGYGIQKWFLNRGPFLPDEVFRRHPFDQATAWLRAADVPISDPEPMLAVTEAAAKAVRGRVGSVGQLISIGIGSSEPYKQWGAPRFARLIDILNRPGRTTFVLVGGTTEQPLAEAIRSSTSASDVTLAIGWNLSEIAALFSFSKYYVGNDTGVMNMAAAVGIPTYCLFGAVPPIHHSSKIIAITPPGGVSRETGMAGISVEQVCGVIEAAQASTQA